MRLSERWTRRPGHVSRPTRGIRAHAIACRRSTMPSSRRLMVTALLAAIAMPAAPLVRAQQNTKPLTEAEIVHLGSLKVKPKDDVVASMVRKRGVDFTADKEMLERLE